MSLRKLKSLELDLCGPITNNGLKIVNAFAPKSLTSLNLGGLVWINDDGIEMLLKKRIEFDSLKSGQNIKEGAKTYLVAQQQLWNIDTNTTGNKPALMIDSMTSGNTSNSNNSTVVRVPTEYHQSPTGAIKLLTQNSFLQQLNLSFLPITNKSLSLVLNLCRDLKVLEITSCEHVKVNGSDKDSEGVRNELYDFVHSKWGKLIR